MNAFVVLCTCASLQDPQEPVREPMPVPVAVACRRDKPIEVDGSLVDWPELPALNLADPRQLSGTGQGAWRGTQDLSAMAFLLWDDEALWFAAVVKDEWHHALEPAAMTVHEIPVADSIVLSIDPRRDTRSFGPDPGRRDDVEFWFGEEASHEVLLWDRFRGSARVLDAGRVVVSHDREQGITTYEAKLPWADVLPTDLAPAAGLSFDLQLVVSDFDEKTDPMPQTRIGWTFGCDPVVDPGLYGTVQLVADAGGLRGGMPVFPPRQQLALPESLGTEVWRAFGAELAALPPAVHDGSNAPEAAGGIARLRLLEWLDMQCERMPRVDYVEFCHRIQRRMAREVAGYLQRGMPWYWNQALQTISKAAEAPPKNGVLRLFRLPQGGFLLRGAAEAALIDPMGADVQQWLWGAAECVVLTQPLDPTRRNEQLLMRIASSKSDRRFYTHAAFHMPLVSMNEMPLVEPGQEYVHPDRIVLRTLGNRAADGAVPYTLGYRIQMPAGPSVLVVGPAVRPQDLPAEHATAMILSPRNRHALAIARQAAVDLVILDDTFLCASVPNVRRVSLRDLHLLQKAILPLPSLVLAPGESWDLQDHR